MIIQSLIGIVALILIAIPFSESIQKIKVKFIIYALLIQTSLAFILLEIPFISSFFDVMSMAVESLRLSAIEGSSFVFGYLGGGTHHLKFLIIRIYQSSHLLFCQC
tara:strand:+ start:124 stop:441 length:318 start_codon:yes stop_codon:yes gene_type:complete